MWDFVSVMADYIYEDGGTYDRTILNTLAGLQKAGVFENTRAEWQSLARRILRSDRETEPNLTWEEAEAFRKIMRERPKENIEELLQRSLEQARDDLVDCTPRQFNFAINKVFARIGWNVNLPCLERFLTRQFELPETRHTFISFNYDLVLDYCIQRQATKQAWDVKTGYGFTVDRFIPPEAAAEHEKRIEKPGHLHPLVTSELNSLAGSDGAVKILKPHGSLNWLLRFEENYLFRDAVPILCLDPHGSITYYDRFKCEDLQLKDRIRDVSADIWSHAGLYLIPPTDSRSRDLNFLKSIRHQEKEAYTTADEIYVIGWSMPATDKDQVEIIRECMQERQRPLERVVAINYGAPPKYYDEIATVFGVRNLQLIPYDAGFCQYVDTTYTASSGE